MEEKTAELRDLFMEVSDDSTVTELQEESTGSLAADRAVDERFEDVLEELRERYGLTADLEKSSFRTVAEAYFTDRDDAAVAAELGIDVDRVQQARLDLHLVESADRDGPIPADRIAAVSEGSIDPHALAAELDADRTAVERQLAALRATARMRRDGYRFRDELAELFGDGDLAEHMPDDVTDDGLAEATADLEIETGF